MIMIASVSVKIKTTKLFSNTMEFVVGTCRANSEHDVCAHVLIFGAHVRTRYRTYEMSAHVRTLRMKLEIGSF